MNVKPAMQTEGRELVDDHASDRAHVAAMGWTMRRYKAAAPRIRNGIVGALTATIAISFVCVSNSVSAALQSIASPPPQSSQRREEIPSDLLDRAYEQTCGLSIPALDCTAKARVLAATQEMLARHGKSVSRQDAVDPLRMLLLFALAKRFEGSDANDVFTTHVLNLLLRDREDASLHAADERRAYATFADRKRTAALRTTLHDDATFDAVRAKLGLPIGAATEPEIVVFDFVDGDARKREFSRLAGIKFDQVTRAWAAAVGGRTYLAFTADFVAAHIGDARGRSGFAHEYVHSQNAMTPGFLLGSLVEERRAEYFSGDHGEYFEVKQFFIYLNEITGFEIKRALDATPRDGAAVFAAMARAIGVEGMLEVATSVPNGYLRLDQPDIEAIDQSLGGRNGVLSRLLDARIEVGERAAIDARLRARMQRIAAATGEDYAWGAYIELMRGSYGLPRIADEIETSRTPSARRPASIKPAR